MPKKRQSDAESKLAPPVVELMKMLFNVETYRLQADHYFNYFSLEVYMPEKLNLNPYRAAMLEFEINMSEMPLGKLSKSNIQKGTYRRKSCLAHKICSYFVLKLTCTDGCTKRKRGYVNILLTL